MRHGTQSRLNLIESDESENETNNDDNLREGAVNNTAIVNVEVHETNSPIAHNNKENDIRNRANSNEGRNDENIIDDTSSYQDDEDKESVGIIVQPLSSNEIIHNIPPDRFNYNYLVFYLLGIATMCPWNFFVTAEDYWMYKFRNVTDNTTDVLTPWQKSFESDITVTASMSGTLFLILNTIYGYLFSIKLKMIGCLTIILAFFVITTAFIEVNTDNWQAGFFALTIGTVININIFSAIFSGALFGIAGLFPSEYMTAVVSGQALGGILTALAFIVTLAFGASIKTTAFAYFVLGNIIILLSIIFYIIMSRTQFFNYYLYEKSEPLIPYDPNDSNNAVLIPNIKQVFHKIYIYALIIFLVFSTSLCVYPSVTVLVRSQYHGNGKAWNNLYFMPVINYLLFNSGDYLGRILAGLYEKPENPHTTLMWAILRMGCVPAFLLCNVDHVYMPTLIHSDATFIMLMAVFSVSNGFLANNVLTKVPKIVMQHEKEVASSIMVTSLSTGLAVGSAASLFLVQVL
ncbi:equilibrative nucleoside transporter 3 [Condylostylus longicornis]|uniref:equilibrative nucleoside transporter 3 n=1 Tax=Condylostylus longicornis TaxID=2530218 RepID=UPI00244E1403|nr:equilibrative nucleoside transporter 3 [Condylostylus longicornis]